MNQTDETKPKEVTVDSLECQLALRRAIDEVLDDLIIASADKISLLENNRNKQNKLALTRSQLRNVVNEASKSSREAVTNFIRYQMGRQGGEAWCNAAPQRKAFGRELLTDIESEAGKDGAVDLALNKVCAAVKKKFERGKAALPVNFADELRRAARPQLISLYLGYLNRTFAYCDAMDGKDKHRECWRDVENIAKRKRGE